MSISHGSHVVVVPLSRIDDVATVVPFAGELASETRSHVLIVHVAGSFARLACGLESPALATDIALVGSAFPYVVEAMLPYQISWSFAETMVGAPRAWHELVAGFDVEAVVIANNTPSRFGRNSRLLRNARRFARVRNALLYEVPAPSLRAARVRDGGLHGNSQPG
jgi:hypothetical protein